MSPQYAKCPLCAAPWERDAGLGIDGRSPGDRYACGSLFIKPDVLVVETKMCRYAAALKKELQDTKKALTESQRSR